MAQLFSKWKIKQEVAAVAGLDIAREIAIVQQLYSDWKKGNADDETRYEQSFNQLFFNELLGYTRNDHMHPKAGTPVWGKIADLWLWLFAEGKYNFDDVQVVVELKGAKIFLDKKQNRQNPQSPVDQGFGYKTSFTKCKRLIVSNFHQVRLYRDNKQDYQEWTLAELASGQDNWFALRSLLVLLSANRLLSSGGESHTEKLMSQFRIEQQKITKKFYQEYKWLRLDLINDIRQHNSGIAIEIVVEKAQKIIDRLVFVHFCEDKGLLPADKLKENIVRAREADFTPWEILKKYFKGVDSWSEKLGIPWWYNGELFKPDAVLDSLIVGDAICMKFIHFGDYDFDDELSVNILGHIFEQSISDLEQLKIDLLWAEVETDQLVENKKQSKRKKDGIFYTPEYIVDYIVQNSLMKYLSEKEDECLAKYKDEQKAYQAYQQILQNVKVLDPACGSGAFLVKVFDVLYAENQKVGQLIGWLFDETETYKNILTNNIYGVDLNPESVEITKLSLWLKSAQKGKKLNNLDKNIKCGNSLIDDPAVAGERAFDWHKEFKDIMDGGWFDVVVGNPPYVDSESMVKSYKEQREYISKTYCSAKGNRDLFVIFVEKGFNLLKKNWYISYILPNKLLWADYAQSLRELINKDGTLLNLIDLSKDNIFTDASVYPIIFVIQNILTNKSDVVVWNNTDGTDYFANALDRKNNNRSLYLNKGKILIDRLLKNPSLENSSYYDIYSAATVSEAYELIEYIEEWQDWYKLVNTWTIDPRLFLWWINKFNYIKKSFNSPTVNFSIKSKIWHNKPKIIVAWMSKKFECWFDEKGEYLWTKSTTVITGWDEKKLKFLLCYLHSSLANYIFSNANSTSVMAWWYMNYNSNNIKALPFKDIWNIELFVDKADQMLALNKEFHEKKSSALNLLQAEYGIEKVSRKLESFWELDFADFLKALGIKSLSLDKKEELMGWFGKKKEELASLQATIGQTDREIDGMVYELYGLSEEEVRVVEGK